MSERRVQSAVAILNDYIACRGMRQTPERISILTEALSLPSHFTSADIAAALKNRGFRYSLTTVYSTLSLLVEAGILRRLAIKSHIPFYEISPRIGGNSRSKHNHHHLVCTRCGRIVESREPDFSPSDICRMMGRSAAGFDAKELSLVIYGLCKRCSRLSSTMLPVPNIANK